MIRLDAQVLLHHWRMGTVRAWAVGHGEGSVTVDAIKRGILRQYQILKNRLAVPVPVFYFTGWRQLPVGSAPRHLVEPGTGIMTAVVCRPGLADIGLIGDWPKNN